MALTKSDHRLEQVSFVFDELGDVKDIVLTVNYAITEDISGREEARVRRSVSVWEGLSDAQKTRADTLAKHLNGKAKSL